MVRRDLARRGSRQAPPSSVWGQKARRGQQKAPRTDSTHKYRGLSRYGYSA